MSNLLIIGLPGCGKTTVGKYIAKELDLPFVDSDMELSFLTDMPTNELFTQIGEEAFRKLETETLKTILQRDGQVVSLGGGIVVKEENRDLLKKETVLFLDPAIEYVMSTKELEDRPILKQKSLRQIKEERQQWYLDCATKIIQEETMDAVLEKALIYAKEVFR